MVNDIIKFHYPMVQMIDTQARRTLVLLAEELTGKVPRKPRLVGGVMGHNMNDISLARILFATTCPGSPVL